MKNIFLVITTSLFGVGAFAQPSNSKLIQQKVLGQVFCYENNNSNGWSFSDEGVAVRHGLNLGMPGPSDYYQLTFNEALRSYGSFDLNNAFETIHFQITHDFELIEYSSGETLSAAACNK